MRTFLATPIEGNHKNTSRATHIALIYFDSNSPAQATAATLLCVLLLPLILLNDHHCHHAYLSIITLANVEHS